MFAVRNEETALDIVQDSMMKLAEKYGDRPAEEFPMLFQRIIQNTIRDYYRRSKVRSLWTTLLSSFSSDETKPATRWKHSKQNPSPSRQTRPTANCNRPRFSISIEEEIKSLPTRQREAFLMRYWEDMDVAETASAMGCSEGSVKTHCSRATHTLAAALKSKGITL
jgi:RNA polymerase sigma-70 factor (ECF subfamily)